MHFFHIGTTCVEPDSLNWLAECGIVGKICRTWNRAAETEKIWLVEEQALGTTGMRCHNNLFCKSPPTRLCQWAFLGVSKCCMRPSSSSSSSAPPPKKNSASSATNVIGHTSPLFVWTRACWVRPWSECSFVCGRLSEGSLKSAWILGAGATRNKPR